MGVPRVGFKRPNRPRRSLVTTSERRDANWQQSYALLKSPQALKQITQGSLGDSELALPQDQNVPSVALQPLQYHQVSFNIGLKLGRPEIDSRLGQNSIFTCSMAMPKTPMYKNTDPESRQYAPTPGWRSMNQFSQAPGRERAPGIRPGMKRAFRLGFRVPS